MKIHDVIGVDIDLSFELFNCCAQGSFVTLGVLNTVGDWRNACIAFSVILLLMGLHWTYSSIWQTTSDRRRQRALQELEGKSD